jgi:hypothetical protein
VWTKTKDRTADLRPVVRPLLLLLLLLLLVSKVLRFHILLQLLPKWLLKGHTHEGVSRIITVLRGVGRRLPVPVKEGN